MSIKNSESHFGSLAILFHWLIAILIISLLCVGLYMAGLPRSPYKYQLFDIHKEFGILVLFLATLRILWRLYNKIPDLNLPRWEYLAARAMHWILYLFMFAMPVTGYFMSSFSDKTVSFFGLFTLPNIVTPNPDTAKLFENIHGYLAYTLIGLLILHVLAALKHHFYHRDDILMRMLKP